MDSGSTTFELVQPSALRREWELRRGEDVRAVLRIPVFRSGARAEAVGRALHIEQQGRFRPEFTVRDETTGDLVARLRRDGRRRLLELDGRVAEWKGLGRKEGSGFVGPEGDVLLRAKVRSGLVRSSGEIRVGASLGEQDGLVAALLASYLLIRKNEQQAAGAAAAVGAATSA